MCGRRGIVRGSPCPCDAMLHVVPTPMIDTHALLYRIAVNRHWWYTGIGSERGGPVLPDLRPLVLDND